MTHATALNPALFRFFSARTMVNARRANSGTIASCPGTLFVNDTGDTDDATPGDGFCDNGSGLCTLRAAIEEANADSACGTITIDATQVSGTINLLAALPDITNSVNINGPGTASLTVQRSVATDFRIFTISNVTVSISGVTISNGELIHSNQSDQGGGIFNTGTLTLTGVIVSGNRTGGNIEDDGGGIFNTGTLTISDSRISNNTANGSGIDAGGGIYNFSGTLTINNTRISDNQVTGGGDDAGGGIYINSGIVTIINSTSTNNEGNAGGGDEGGGIYNLNGTVTMINGTLAGNFAVQGALNKGGGIYNAAGGTVDLINCTVSANALNGGAGNQGGGIYNLGALNLRNTIVASNSNSAGSGPDVNGAFTSRGHNFIGEADGSTGLTDGVNGDQVGTTTTPKDPLLGPLQNNGGPRQTMALGAGSTAIDAGDNCVLDNSCSPPVGAAVTTDERGAGFPRQTDGDGDGTATVDIGAFEATEEPSITAISVTLHQGATLTAAQIAMVNDALNGAASVTETVNGGASASDHNVTIQNIANNAGTVTADVVTDCSATNATFTLTATTTGGGTKTAILNVTVTANTAPVLTYNSATVAAGGSTTVNPATPPSDDVAVTSILVQDKGTYTGTMTVDPVTGVVSISNAAPAGSHTITIRASDSCTFTDTTFTLDVSCPTITIGPPSLPNDVAGNAFNHPLSASGGTAPYTFSITGGTGPAGLVLNTDGTWSGAPSIANTFTFTVTATDSNGCTGTIDYTCIVTSCPSTFTLDDTGDAGDATPGDGLCDDGAGHCTLRAAIEEANADAPCGTIAIDATGVTGEIDLNNELPAINHDVNIDGPLAGTLTVKRSALSNFRIFAINNGITVSIDSLTIANGQLSDLNTIDQGAGIFNAGTLTLTNSTVSGNTVNGTQPDQGGGLYNSGTLTVTNCAFSGNTAGGGGDDLGGAIFSTSGTATISGSSFSGNSTRGSGNDRGGAIYVDAGTVNITNSTLSSNTAQGGTADQGGGIYVNGGSLNLTNSTLSANVANGLTADQGGGIFVNGGTVNLVNCTLSGNEAAGTGRDQGGAIYCAAGIVELCNCTLASNAATNGLIKNDGGGIYNELGTVSPRNTIIALNTADTGLDVFGAFASLGHNFIGTSDNSTGFGATGDQVGSVASPLDPLLGPLASNGGPTQTRALGAGSTAIDAGDDCVAGLLHCGDANIPQLTTDQRGAGFPRQIDGDANGTAVVDIGAFEGSTCTTPPATPTASNGGPYCEGATIQLSTPTVSGATYSWTGPNGFTSNAQNPTKTNATTADAGTYFVTITVNGCTSAPGSTTVVVNPTPASPTASNGGPYCEGATIQLSTPTVSGATYSWTGPNGFTSNAQNPTVTNATTANAGTYSVTITVNGCTSAAGTTNVAVNTTPTASNSGPYCEGQTIQLSTATVSGATYAWTGPNGYTSAQQNPAIANATTANAGVYSVTVTVNGCTSAAGTTNVVVLSTLATFTVNSLGETSDANPGDGLCADGTNNCTLRAAIEEANADPACRTITIDASGVSGQIVLTSALPDINHAVTINGPGANLLTVQRSTVVSTPGFRVFRIVSVTVSINGLTISNGLVNTGGMDQGGGIFNDGNLTLTAVTISGNHLGGIGNDQGAGIFNNVGRNLMILNSAITGDSVNSSGADQGGGIFNGGTLTLVNSTVSGNSLAGGSNNQGGGIYNDATGTLRLINDTISNNSVAAGVSQGGGIFQFGTAVMRNTILAGNTATFGPDINGPLTSQGHNVIGDTTNFATTITPQPGDLFNAAASPLNLGALQNNGGPTQTMALGPGSVAIDAGDDCVFTDSCSPAVGVALTTDQRGGGFTRQADGDGNGTATVDIGAFEAPTAPSITAVSVNTHQGVTSNFQIATVNDTGGAGSVTVTVNSGSTATVNGVIVSNILNTSGTVTADVAALCNATDASFTLTATNTGGGASIATLSVTVTANTAPVLTYNPATVAPGGSTTVNPASGPSDDVAVTSITVQSQGTYTGTISVDSVTGIVSISNAAPAGSHTITIRASDSCTFTDTQFTLDVSCPAFTVSPSSLPAGFVGLAYNNPLTASGGTGPYTFAVTGGTQPTGLILNADGTWSGTPSAANTFNFTVTATDSIGCTGTRNYTVTIISCPTTLTLNNAGDTDDSVPGDGICDDGAGHCTLRAAITEANALSPCGPIIIDATGVSGQITLTSALPDIDHDIQINGPGAAQLTVSGNNLVRGFSINSGRTVTISNLTVSHGLANSQGAGIFNNGNLTLRGVILSNNSIIAAGNDQGGAIFTSNGSLTITDSTLSGNSLSGTGANNQGGAIYILNSIVTIARTTIANNTTSGATNNSGGCIYNTIGSLTITDSTFNGNSVSGGSNNNLGGCIANHDTATIINSTLTGNTITVGGSNDGGAIFNIGTLTLTNSTISGNSVSSGSIENVGGGVWNGATVNTANTIIAGNTGASGPDVFSFSGAAYTSQGHNFIGKSDGSIGFTDGVNFDQVGSVAAPKDPLLGPPANNGGPTQTMALGAGSTAMDAGGDLTTLSLDIADTVTTTVNVADATSIPAGVGFLFQIDSEQMSVTSKSTNTLTVVRGANSTTAATHTAGVAVNPAFDQRGTPFQRKADGNTINPPNTPVVDIGAFEAQTATAVDDSYATNEDTPLSVITANGVLANDTGSGTKTVSVFTAPSHAAFFTLNADGSFLYTPAPDFNGSDSFVYTLTAGGATANATVTITVNAVNDPPSFTKGGDQTVLEDAGAQTVTNWATSISAGPADESGQTLTFNVTNNSNTSLFSAQPAINAAGTLTFTPAANANGSATITLTLQDNGGTANGGIDTSAAQRFIINVTAVNDPPSFSKGPDQSVAINSGPQTVNAWATNISAGPPDESAQTRNFIVNNNNNALFSAQPAVDAATGTMTYTPAANAFGQATVSVSLHDNGGTANSGVDTSAVQTFTITVAGAVTGSKSVTGDTVPGSSISYSIVLTNNIGTAQADNSGDEFTDVLPAGLTLLAADSGTGAATVDLPGNTVHWNGAIAAGSTATIMISAKVNAGTEGQTIANTGTIHSDTDNNGTNETTTSTNTVSFTVCPATSVVTNSNDSGAGSLRQAILDGCSGATITFDVTPGHVTSPITLTSGELVIDKTLTIAAPATTGLTISGNNASRVFNVQPGNALTISNLTINNAKVTSGNGGAILSAGDLTILNSTFTGNTAVGGEGGAISSEGGPLRIINSTISGNSADKNGGGVANRGSSTGFLTNVTITNNRSDNDNDGNGDGGGLAQTSSNNLTLNNAIVAGNFKGLGTTANDFFVGSSVNGASSHNLVGVDTGLNSGISNGVNGNQVGTAASPINAQLHALGNNGGLTQTHLPLPNSPAVNAGDNAAAVDQNGVPLATDQRASGFNRIANTTVDIGSVEANYTVTATAGTPQSAPLNSAFVTQLQATVTESAGILQNGVAVTFTAPVSGPSGSFSGSATVNTNASGIAIAPIFTANGIAGPYNVIASIATNLSPTNFALTNNKLSQTINFGSLANKTFGDPDFTVSATATSGLAVSLAATGNCTVTTPSPGTVHLTGAGSCMITASQAGDASHSPAADVPQGFTIVRANQTITFGALANKTFGDPDFTVSPTATSGLAVSLAATSNCTVTTPSPGTVHLTGAGSCTITASQAGDTNYNPAAPVGQSFTINKASQTITFAALPNKTFGDPDFMVSATATSGLQVSLGASVNCTIAGNTVHLTGAGSCTITASQAGDTNYNAAANVPQTFTIAKATTTVSVSSVPNPSDPGQNVTFTATLNGVAVPTGTIQFKDNGANLGAPAVVNAGGIAQFSTSSLTIGIHIITADYSGDANFQPSTGTLAGGQTVLARALIKFSQPNYSVNESGHLITISVVRSGDTNTTVSVDYATPDDSAAVTFVPCANPSGVASPRCDFTTALGTLKFAAGETSKAITVLISQDVWVEGNETVPLTLSNPTGGAAFQQPADANAVLTIVDDDVTPPTININDNSDAFVRQHYHDFLNREADPPGLAFWTNEIESCGTDVQCRAVKRVNVSAAFFLSIEFQNTGYFVERTYKAGFGDINPPTVPVPVRFTNFLDDSQDIRAGVVVGVGDWQGQLAANKKAFAQGFVQRAAFLTRYPSQTAADVFVDSLNTNAGMVLSATERSALIAELTPNPADPVLRADVLQQVADNAVLQQREFNRAFVLMQYFGYLRRNPDAAPEAALNFAGYNFWLNKLNQFNGDYIGAEMIKAFITSGEYRGRFGP